MLGEASVDLTMVEGQGPRAEGQGPRAECRVPSAKCRVPSAGCRVPRAGYLRVSSGVRSKNIVAL